MPVHVFPVQSVQVSVMGGDSIENIHRLARIYLGQHSQSGETAQDYMECANRAAVEAAVDAFLNWSQQQASEDPKVLWLSLHGKPPESPMQVGTSAVSSAYQSSEPEAGEIVEWSPTFAKLRGSCPDNVVVVSDVCWGASPTAPTRLTAKGGKNPAMLFGPVRAAHRIELDTAAGLIFGMLAQGKVPTIDEARATVSHLNTCFPRDQVNNRPFYRVSWWDEAGGIHRHPDAPEHKFRSRHVLPNF